MSRFLDTLTPLLLVQAILSIMVLAAFVFQEVTIHAVDPDLKLVTFGVVGYWLGGVSFFVQAKLVSGAKSNGE